MYRHWFQESRKRQNSTILIQALARGYLTRQRHKRLHREEFDRILQEGKGAVVDDRTLVALIQKLLFFFSDEVDGSRLVSE